MINILFVANWKSDVGYAWWLMENFWVQLSKLAQQKNVKSHLIYPEITRIPDPIKTSAIQVHQLDYEDNSIPGLLHLVRFILAHKIKCIYFSDKSYLSLKYLLLRCFGVQKIIVHDHTPGVRTVPVGLRRFVKEKVHALPLITADALIAVTYYVQERHLRSNCIPRRKSYVAQNGIVPIGRNPEYRHYCHDIFGIPHNATVVFTSGRASRYKQIDFIIECANILINEDNINDLYFIYCGDGPDFNNLQNLVYSCRLQVRFIFAGNRSDVRQIAQSCHIGIQASKGEVGYSLSILEYMSAGLATLAPDNPSVCASITHEVTGLIYKENNISSACDNLRRVIRDLPYRETLGRMAMHEIMHNYNLEKTNRQLENAVSSACDL